MNEQEYLDGTKVIEKKAALEKRELNFKYAYSNQSRKMGDTISSNVRTIIIDRIQVGFRFGRDIPECVYKGFMLTAKGNLRKDESRGSVFQSEITGDK